MRGMCHVKNKGDRSNCRTSAVIAQLLDAEGFSPFVANRVKRYWMNTVCRRTPEAKRRIDRVRGK